MSKTGKNQRGTILTTLAPELEKIILSYMDEETDGEFLRYYRLNPVCLKPMIEEILEWYEITN